MSQLADVPRPDVGSAFLRRLVETSLEKEEQYAANRGGVNLTEFYPSVHNAAGCPGEAAILKLLAARGVIVPLAAMGTGATAAGQGFHDYAQGVIFPAGLQLEGGWRVQAHEVPLRSEIEFDGVHFSVRARVDTVLAHETGAIAYLDYKTVHPYGFRVRDGESLAEHLLDDKHRRQVNAYCHLTPEQDRDKIALLALVYARKDNWAVTETVPVEPDPSLWAEDCAFMAEVAAAVQSGTLSKEMFRGADIPAYGKTKCDYCTAQKLGLCPRHTTRSFGKYATADLLAGVGQQQVFEYLKTSMAEVADAKAR